MTVNETTTYHYTDVGMRQEIDLPSGAGEGFVHGVEANSSWRIHPQLTLFGWVSWMEGEADGFPTSAPVTREEYLSRAMPLSGEIGLRWDTPSKRFWVELVGLMADKQDKLSSSDKVDTQRIPPGGMPGYGVVTARGGWRVNQHLTMAAALENIADKDYRVHGSGINESGRNILVSATARF